MSRSRDEHPKYLALRVKSRGDGAVGCSFHEVEPQSFVMELLRPSQLSRKVLAPPRGRVPASELATNTLVLSGPPPRLQGDTPQAPFSQTSPWP